MHYPTIAIELDSPFFGADRTPYTAVMFARQIPQRGDLIQCGDLALKVETVVWPFANKGGQETNPTIWVEALPNLMEYRETLLKAGFKEAHGVERP